MMQQVNLLQNNRSVFQTVVAFVVPNTGPIHLVLVGLMAVQQAEKNLCLKNYNSTSNAFFINFWTTIESGY